MAVQLVHERLAKAHDFIVRLALRIEIAAALGAADGQAGQRIFENLLEAEKLDDPRIHARVQPDAALVRTQRRIELDPVALVDLHMALVVDPRDAEHDLALRLDDAVDDVVLLVSGILIQQRPQRHQDFFDRLVVFDFGRAGAFEFCNGVCYVGQDNSPKGEKSASHVKSVRACVCRQPARSADCGHPACDGIVPRLRVAVSPKFYGNTGAWGEIICRTGAALRSESPGPEIL